MNRYDCNSVWYTMGMAIGLMIAGALPVWGGSLESPAPPHDSLSEMYTLVDIYNRLESGIEATPSAFAGPTAAPLTGTGRSLNEIMNAAPKRDVNAASDGDVLVGTAFWGLSATGWGPRVGTMPVSALSATSPYMSAGYYAETNLTLIAEDLVPENIKWGAVIFGIVGTLPGGRVPKTGQTAAYETGDDGYHRRGVELPDPRFTVGDGIATNCVTDELTGLMWAIDASIGENLVWSDALLFCNNLIHGGYNDWRLPNLRELQSLMDYGRVEPALPFEHPFANVLTVNYWTGTSHANNTGNAWTVRLSDGAVNDEFKTLSRMAWPVRGGQ